MTKRFDDFSKRLAGGASPRRAFWQLLTGAAAIGVLSGARAEANSAHPIDPSCPTLCFQQANLAFTECVDDVLESSPSTPFGAVIGICLGAQTALYQRCLVASQYCPPKQCATVHYTLSNGDLHVTNVSCILNCSC